jgi:transcriptional regulator with XRE-family HTH domain
MPRASQTRVGLEYLRTWRVWKGYSQQELAELAGVAKSTITQLELGRATANFVTIGKLAKAFNISREQLLHEPPEPTLSQPNT